MDFEWPSKTNQRPHPKLAGQSIIQGCWWREASISTTKWASLMLSLRSSTQDVSAGGAGFDHLADFCMVARSASPQPPRNWSVVNAVAADPVLMDMLQAGTRLPVESIAVLDRPGSGRYTDRQ
jgi:hypothetical protein